MPVKPIVKKAGFHITLPYLWNIVGIRETPFPINRFFHIRNESRLNLTKPFEEKGSCFKQNKGGKIVLAGIQESE
jgi:hypothetical protein